MTTRRRLLLFLPLLPFDLGACKSLGSMGQKDSEKSLQLTLRAYETTLRWGNPADIYGFLDPELRAAAPAPDTLHNIQVTGYQVTQRPNLVEEERAGLVAEIRYVFKDRQIERRLRDEQLWSHDKEHNTWRRINPIPPFD
ncbi:MAG: hypothetical protein AB2814_02015 [Candidatus Sedimenticola endophacoides]